MAHNSNGLLTWLIAKINPKVADHDLITLLASILLGLVISLCLVLVIIQSLDFSLKDEEINKGLFSYAPISPVEDSENAFFILFYVIGGVGALIGAIVFPSHIHHPWVTIIGVLFLVPFLNHGISSVFTTNPADESRFVCLLAVIGLQVMAIIRWSSVGFPSTRLFYTALLWVYIVGYLYLMFFPHLTTKLSEHGVGKIRSCFFSCLGWFSASLWGNFSRRDVVITGLICAFLIPFLMWWLWDQYAQYTGLNDHPVSFILGPSIYSAFGEGLIPSIDYYTQYSDIIASLKAWTSGVKRDCHPQVV